jgi:hypothetical protein
MKRLENDRAISDEAAKTLGGQALSLRRATVLRRQPVRGSAQACNFCKRRPAPLQTPSTSRPANYKPACRTLQASL